MHRSETDLQSLIRIKAMSCDIRLWRNNVGAALTRDGRPVRYGLANDSKTLNSVLKSSDLIGIRGYVITEADIGKTIGQFVSYEIKKPGWKYTGTPHERAQLAWIELINNCGGEAKFISTLEDIS